MAERLDGAGVAKLATLDDALTQLQRVYALVERMAAAARSHQDAGQMRQQIQRAASPLVGLLKPQFGMIADQISQMILILTRGGGDQMKVRALREGVAQVRTQLEISMAKVREQHTITEA
jgi:hypothetical protein